jgi:hypothetical protein
VILENVSPAGETFCDFVFVIVKKHSTVRCRYREPVKLFRFLLSPHRLIGTCNNEYNCIILSRAEGMGGCANVCIILGSPVVTKSENPRTAEFNIYLIKFCIYLMFLSMAST